MPPVRHSSSRRGTRRVYCRPGTSFGKTPHTDDVEMVKLRFASVTFAGVFILFALAAALFLQNPIPNGPGQVIFDRLVTAVTPLTGVIIGYLFGTRGKATQAPGTVLPEANQ